ncbi:helix-turn-helix domain-containing protein [Anaerococcus hydrogenalis]|uniref:helix-turn-helix domain-containing protein n=1 Tax=Anaerococcus hydrogenalis TaxID=33029 RepID=UPI0023F291A9|nr:helix-turn-helix transcriptional regulator [Anaerococcus hydrogenalis]
MGSTIGKNISKYRRMKNLTQKDLSDQVSISRSFMSQIENGISNPSDDTLNKIAKVLEVNINDLKNVEPSSPIEELFALLINLTEKEIIKWEIEYDGDGSNNFFMETNIKGVGYYFSFYPNIDHLNKKNGLLIGDYEVVPRNENEYELLKKLYETIMIFHNPNNEIYKSINDLKSLLDE